MRSWASTPQMVGPGVFASPRQLRLCHQHTRWTGHLSSLGSRLIEDWDVLLRGDTSPKAWHPAVVRSLGTIFVYQEHPTTVAVETFPAFLTFDDGLPLLGGSVTRLASLSMGGHLLFPQSGLLAWLQISNTLQCVFSTLLLLFLDLDLPLSPLVTAEFLSLTHGCSGG